MTKRGFASDNNSGAHPRILDAMSAANHGHVLAYGDDELTRRVTRRLREAFGARDAFLVFNGTGANVLCLAAMTRPYHAVLCAEGAHLAADECGAPERFAGVKLITIPTPDGKLTPELLQQQMKGLGEQHHVQPRVVTLTQATELGTVYRAGEVAAICEWAHERGLLVHMDGARLANACAALGLGLLEATGALGVDALSFGGTKNGLVMGDAVILFRDDLAEDFRFVRKQGMQLASKMRFLAAQFDAYLEDELWLKNAQHANDMAALLAKEAAGAGIRLARAAEANEVFALLPRDAIAKAQAEWPFYTWDEARGEVRWVCSWDTTPEDVHGLVASVKRAMH